MVFLCTFKATFGKYYVLSLTFIGLNSTVLSFVIIRTPDKFYISLTVHISQFTVYKTPTKCTSHLLVIIY